MTPRPIDRWRSGKSRRFQRRPQRRRILIVCEGKETERNYFDQLRREGWAKENLAVTVKRGKGGSREQIARFAVRLKKEANTACEPFDKVWCVMDVEKPTDRDDCRVALRILGGHEIEPCLSNPAFEVWLLSHFQRTTNSYLDCDAVIRDLTPIWNARFNRDYEKGEPNLFKMVSSLTATAIENARWAREVHHSSRPILDCNAATDVYRFVERLLGPSA